MGGIIDPSDMHNIFAPDPCFGPRIGPGIFPPKTEEQTQKEREATKKIEEWIKQKLAEKEEKVKEIVAAESTTDLSKLIKRADELSYRAWPENMNKTDKQLITELLAKLLAESGELAGACETYFGRSLRPELVAGNFDEVEGEIGDTLVVLLRIASIFAVDPQTAIGKTLDKFEKRLERIGK